MSFLLYIYTRAKYRTIFRYLVDFDMQPHNFVLYCGGVHISNNITKLRELLKFVQTELQFMSKTLYSLFHICPYLMSICLHKVKFYVLWYTYILTRVLLHRYSICVIYRKKLCLCVSKSSISFISFDF